MKNWRIWGIFAGLQAVGVLCVAMGYKIGFLTVVFGTVLHYARVVVLINDADE